MFLASRSLGRKVSADGEERTDAEYLIRKKRNDCRILFNLKFRKKYGDTERSFRI